MTYSSKTQLREKARRYREWWEATSDVPYGLCKCGCGQRTPLASRTDASRQWVKGEPRPFVDTAHGNYVDWTQHLKRYRIENHGYETPCWIWTGDVYSTGYGRLKYRGRAYSAHRFFYECEHGPPPTGTQLHHLCENILCVRVSHLQPLSPASHVHLRCTTKLTTAKAADIRLLRAAGKFSHAHLAAEFGVSPTLVTQVIHNKIWSG